MPEYNETIRHGYKSVTKLQKTIREMSSNAGKPFAAAWIGLATRAAEAQDVGVHKAILRRQFEHRETICSCGVIAKDAPLEKTQGHLDQDQRVLDVIILEVKPERYMVVCIACGAKQKTPKPTNQDDAVVTMMQLRHRRGCLSSHYCNQDISTLIALNDLDQHQSRSG